MAVETATTTTASLQGPTGSGVGNEQQSGSKFKRFLRKFGRKPSDDAEGQVGGDANEHQRHHHEGNGSAAPTSAGNVTGTGTNGSLAPPGSDAKSRRASKQRGNSLLGKASLRSKTPQGSNAGGNGIATKPQAPSTPRGSAPNATTTGAPTPNFAGSSGQGLADTLVVAEPPPQLSTPERLAPINPIDVAAAAPVAAASSNGGAIPSSTTTATPPRPVVMSESSGSPARSRDDNSFDIDSTEGFRKRDSVDNRTMDTGKSTKPTTLMSLDREPSSQMAHIAQYRHGEYPSSSSAAAAASSSSSAPLPPGTLSNNPTRSPSSVQFVPASSGPATNTIPASPSTTYDSAVHPSSTGNGGHSVYMNAPTLSRPHPANNPHPTAYPPDNASVLTLASSTAAQSIAGGATSSSSRGHGGAGQHGQTPSLSGGGRARSLVGSLMGERRNSSDTYASVKALPPLSRRGSDDSTRTSGRESVGAASSLAGGGFPASGSSTNVATAGMGSGAAGVVGAPGAPHDRLSIVRTPSQRTVATQLSIPLSGSSQILSGGGGAPGGADRRASSGSAHLLQQQATAASSAATTSAASASTAGAGATPTSSIAPHAGNESVEIDADDDLHIPGGNLSTASADVTTGGLSVPEITQTRPSPSPTDEGAERQLGMGGIPAGAQVVGEKTPAVSAGSAL